MKRQWGGWGGGPGGWGGGPGGWQQPGFQQKNWNKNMNRNHIAAKQDQYNVRLNFNNLKINPIVFLVSNIWNQLDRSPNQ